MRDGESVRRKGLYGEVGRQGKRNRVSETQAVDFPVLLSLSLRLLVSLHPVGSGSLHSSLRSLLTPLLIPVGDGSERPSGVNATRNRRN